MKDSINWEQVRADAAIAAMQAFITRNQYPCEGLANRAVDMADMLVARLQVKKKGEESHGKESHSPETL